jgi:hypothetical protein
MHNDSTNIDLLVHPKIGEMLFKEETRNLELLEKSLYIEITIVLKPEFHLEQYQIKYL